MRSPGRALRIDRAHALRHHADAGGGDEDLVALAAIDDLGVAGDERHAGLVAGLPHGSDDALQIVQRQSFFEDERGRQEQAAGRRRPPGR